MKKTIFVLAMLLISNIALAASIPRYITVQGKLTDASDLPVASGSYLFNFTVYNSSVAGSGKLIWTEQFYITVTNGLFNTVLTAPQSPPGIAYFDEPYFLEVKVGTNTGNLNILQPRVSITSAGYAFVAAGISGNLDMKTNNITNIGYVGIGTNNPTQKLDVNGNINATGTAGTGSISTVRYYGPDSGDCSVWGCYLTPSVSSYIWALYVNQTLNLGGYGVLTSNYDFVAATASDATVSGKYNSLNIQLKPGVVTNPEIANNAINSTQIIDGAVVLATDTTGNYVGNVTAGSGISISGTVGEGWSPTITNTGDLSSTNEIQNVIANKGLQRDGSNNFGIINCADGQTVKYNAAGQWVCSADNTGITTSGWSMSGVKVYNDTTGVMVGIGTNNPTQKLDVNGNINATGTAGTGSISTVRYYGPDSGDCSVWGCYLTPSVSSYIWALYVNQTLNLGGYGVLTSNYDFVAATASDATVSGKYNSLNIQLKPGVVTNPEIANNAINSTQIIDGAVVLATDTTGNYVGNVTAGSGISISGTVGEGWSPTITNTGDLSSTNEIQNVIANKGLQRDGSNNFGIINCADGQTVKYNAAGQWVCSADNTGITTSGWSMSGVKVYNDTTGVMVGIGTNNPTQKLDVNGNINATGTAGTGSISTVRYYGPDSGDCSVWGCYLTPSVSSYIWALYVNQTLNLGGYGVLTSNYDFVAATASDATVSGKYNSLNIQLKPGVVTNPEIANNAINSTQIIDGAVVLATDTTGNYVGNVTAGSGISISGTVGEGWSPTITNTGDLSSTNEIQNVIANKGLQRDGSNNFGIINCADGQTVKYNAAGQWVCSADNTGITTSGWSMSGVKVYNDTTGVMVGIGTTNPQSKLHIQGGITTPYDVTYQHYESSWGVNIIRPYLRKSWSAANGDFLYLGSTGNTANTNQMAMLMSTSLGVLFGKGSDDGLSLSTEWMRINAAGNVGIGTANPSGKLTVTGSSGDARSVTIDNREIKFRGDGVAHFSIFGPDTGKSYLTIQNTGNNYLPGTAGTDLLTILTGGNVGIGINNPGSTLHVVGQGQFAVDSVVADTANYGTLGVTRAASANTLSYIAMTRSGNVVKAMGIDSSNRWVFGLPTAGTQIISTPQMVIEQAGNVGIGTTTPGAKLEVAGQIKITGGTPGASKVLTSDASGLASWQVAGGLSGGSINNLTKWTSSTTVGNSTIYDNGYVGIGTTNPGGTLDVNGRAGATSLKVSSTFSDLVNNAPWYGIGTSSISLWTGQPTYYATQLAGYYGLNFQTANGQMVIKGDNGYVGIGTTTPPARVTIANAQSNSKGLEVKSGDVSLLLYEDTTTNGGVIQVKTGGNPSIIGTGNYRLLLQPEGGDIGIGKTDPSAKLHLAGNMKIDSNNVLEFGAGVTKEYNAGKIGYQTFDDALDIVGAGTGTPRKVRIYDYLEVNGKINDSYGDVQSCKNVDYSQASSAQVITNWYDIDISFCYWYGCEFRLSQISTGINGGVYAWSDYNRVQGYLGTQWGYPSGGAGQDFVFVEGTRNDGTHQNYEALNGPVATLDVAIASTYGDYCVLYNHRTNKNLIRLRLTTHGWTMDNMRCSITICPVRRL